MMDISKADWKLFREKLPGWQEAYMEKLHDCLIREGTCATSEQCDYCICGARNPLAKEYELWQVDNGVHFLHI